MKYILKQKKGSTMNEKIVMNKYLLEDLLHFETASLLSEDEYLEYQKTGKVPAFKAIILQESMFTKLAGSVIFGIPAMLAKKAIDGAKARIKDLDAMVSDLTSKTMNDKTISSDKKEKIKLALAEYNLARKEAKRNTPSAIFTVFSEFVRFATICIAGLSLIALPTVLAKLSVFLSFGIAKLGFMAYNVTDASASGAVGGAIMNTALKTVEMGVSSTTAMEVGTNIAHSVTSAMATANSVVIDLASNFAPELAQASAVAAAASVKAFASMYTVGMSGLVLSPVGMFIVGAGVSLIVGYLIKKIWDYKSGNMTSDQLKSSLDKLDAKAEDLIKTAKSKDSELVKKGDTKLKEHLESCDETSVSLLEAEQLEEGNWALTKYKGGKTVVGGLTSFIFGGGPAGLIAYLLYKKAAREQFVNKVKAYVGEKQGEELNAAITRYRDKANPADEAIIAKYQVALKAKLKK